MGYIVGELSNVFMAYNSVKDAWLPTFGFFVSKERARKAIQTEEYRHSQWNKETRDYEYTESKEDVELRRSNWIIVEMQRKPLQTFPYKE